MNENNTDKKYSYQGENPIAVKAITFHSMPDYIFTIHQWNDTGGWKGILKTGAFCLKDVKKVITGTMSPVDFGELNIWEG